MEELQVRREVITTSDGSKSIFLPELNENYHSNHGALQEAEHVFIQNGLSQFFGNSSLVIFELGFGTGLNALLTLVAAEKNKISIDYVGIEAFPVEQELVQQLAYEQLVDAQFSHFYSELHASTWNEQNRVSEFFTLEKIHAKVENYSPRIGSVDMVYFDAFGPRAQKEMWEINILEKMFNLLKPSGILVTYCANGQFKRDLKALGFSIEVLPGPPGKREMTRATKII
jgi:tRNA U34 5-methylaminomethyl-2-thiouridine-forming methyltransferase MnmC